MKSIQRSWLFSESLVKASQTSLWLRSALNKVLESSQVIERWEHSRMSRERRTFRGVIRLEGVCIKLQYDIVIVMQIIPIWPILHSRGWEMSLVRENTVRLRKSLIFWPQDCGLILKLVDGKCRFHVRGQPWSGLLCGKVTQVNVRNRLLLLSKCKRDWGTETAREPWEWKERSGSLRGEK